jgi:membrane protease YdiL (CAAX protease family)
MLAFSCALAFVNDLARVLAVLVAVDVAAMALPWRVPRAGRSMRSILLENLAYQAMPLGALTAVLAAGPSWLGRAGSWWWYPISALVGTALVWISGLDLRGVASGELAFLMGPRPRAHAHAHTAAALIGPPGEEAMFRGPVLLATGASSAVISTFAAAAFIARHHLPPRPSAPFRPRVLATELAASLLLSGLVLASRSLYPAVVAHLINNAPQALLEVQRGRIGGER